MTRLIAGFLFAVVIIVVGHFGAWLLAANHAQEKFVGAIKDLPNLTLNYERIIPKGYPQEVKLHVRGMGLKWTSPDQEQTVNLTMPQLTIQTPLFDMRKALVDLSREFEIDIQHNNEQMRRFRVVAEGASFSSFFRPDNTTEHAFNVDNFTLWDEVLPQSAAPVLKTGVGYLVREVPGIRSPVSWRVSVQDAIATNNLAGQPFELNRLVAVFGFESDFFSEYGSTLLPVLSPAESQRQEARHALADKLSQTRLEPHILIDSMQVEKDENWVSLRGAFGLNNHQYLDGRLSLNAKNLTPVIQFMQDVGLIQVRHANNGGRLAAAIKEITSGNMSIIFERDRAYINNEHLTNSPTLRELLTRE